jgi:hypothetical protein
MCTSVMGDHLSCKTTFAWPQGWSPIAGFTVSQALRIPYLIPLSNDVVTSHTNEVLPPCHSSRNNQIFLLYIVTIFILYSMKKPYIQFLFQNIMVMLLIKIFEPLTVTCIFYSPNLSLANDLCYIAKKLPFPCGERVMSQSCFTGDSNTLARFINCSILRKE